MAAFLYLFWKSCICKGKLYMMDLAILLLACVAPVVQTYSSGQVTESCEDLRPHHSGLNPQRDPSPFSISTDRSSFRLGEAVTVHLQGPDSMPFRGFLLQARQIGEKAPVGSFSLTTEGAQLIKCSGRSKSTVSHTSKSAKTSVRILWTSEAQRYTNSIIFHATFVQDYRTFWVNVTSPALNFSNDDNSGDSSSAMSPTAKVETTTHQPAPPAQDISRLGCGVTKLCFSQPPNCDPEFSTNCYFMAVVMLSTNNGAFQFELTGPSDGYISFGFSDDRIMGNDDIYICSLSSDGLVSLQHAFSTGRTIPRSLPLGNVSDVRATFQNGVISCSFTSSNPISIQRTAGSDKSYHLMFAHGPSSSNGQIKFHTATFTSRDKVDLSRPQLVGTMGQSQIIKTHGALMLIAWMTTGSLGMMTARYVRGIAKGWTIFGKDMWFVVHVALMSLTVTATVVAFILPFTQVKGWSGGAHPVLGCLVMILSVIQLFLALLRCGPQHPQRFLFKWSHALNAAAIKVLAVAAIFTGLKLIDSTLEQWLVKVMGALVGWEALFYILLDVYSRCTLHRTDASESTTRTSGVLLVSLFFVGNFAFLVSLLTGIGISYVEQ